MVNFTESAAALDRFAVQFKAIIDLADGLRDIGSLEQAAREALARKDAALAEHQSWLSKIDEAKAHLEKLQSQHQQVTAAADAAKLEADTHVASVITQANDHATSVIEAAHQEAQDVLLKAHDAAQEIHLDVQAKVEQAQNKLAEVSEAHDKKVSVLAELEKRIEAARENARKLLGI